MMRAAALWATALFAFSIPFENAIVIANVGSLARLVGVAAFAVVVMSLFGRDVVRVRAPSAFLVVAALYCLWSVTSFYWSIVPAVSVGGATTLAQLAIMIWLVHQVGSTDRNRDVLAQAFVLGSYVTIIIALGAFAASGGEAFRDVGAFNPNWFAIGLAFTVPIAWGLSIRSTRPLLVWLNGLYPLFAAAALVVSASRGGFVTALVAFCVIPLTMTRLSLPRRLVMVAVFAMVVGAGVTYAPRAFPQLQQNIERLGTTAGEVAGEGTFTGRTEIWTVGAEAFLQSPIAGLGVNTFRYAVEEAFGRPRAAHNAFLSVAVGTGTIGLLLFLAMIGVAFVGVVSVPHRRIELSVLIVTLLVGMTPANLEHTKAIWFILAWIAVARPVMIVGSRAPASPAPSRPVHARPTLSDEIA